MSEKYVIDGTLYKPMTGTVLAVASGLSFFVLAMMLPLVGPSGSRMDHAAQNKEAFLSVLLLTFLLAAFATWSKLGRRKVDGGPRPWFCIGICTACIGTLAVLLFNGFAI